MLRFPRMPGHGRRSGRAPSTTTIPALVALVVATLPGLLASPAAAAAAPLPPDGYVGVDGHGWGHARGLGQWGAKGLADQGKSWTEILAHYYTGTALAARPQETIRVLVEDSADVVVTARAHPFRVQWAGGTTLAQSSAENPFLRAAVSGSGLAIQRAPSAGGPWTTITTGNSVVEFHPGAQPLGLVLAGGATKYYRGLILARRPAGTSSALAINELGVEPYLYGVVPREVPSSWNENVLKAQAVAARTYAVTKKDAARAGGKLYDICATTSCQVYGGYASAPSPDADPKVLEAASTNAAIDATAGKVLHYGGAPILAEYSSSTGGYTAPGSNGWQQAKPDPTDAVSPHHSWTTRVSVPAIQNAWPEVGSLVNVRVTKRNGYGDWGGRVTEVVVEGTSGSVTVSGGAMRSKLGLKSDWFRVRTYRADLVNLSSEVSGPSGTQIPVSVYLKNTGTAEWRVGGSEVIATWEPSGRSSRFAHDGWRSESKAAPVTRNVPRPSATTIGPGEVAEFRFTLDAAGVAPGVYTETFRPLVDGLTWMPDVGISVTVRIHSSWLEVQGNMLTNGSFEAGWSPWSVYGRYRNGDGPVGGTVRDGVRSMHLSAAGRKGLLQRLSLAGGAGRRMVLSGWARTAGTNARGGPILITVALRNTDGSVSWNAVEFSRAPHDWQYVERTIVAPKAFSSAELYATFYDQTGHVYFDALRLLDTHIANPSFEMGTGGWSGTGLGAGDGPSMSVFHDGFRSMHFAGGSKSLAQRVGIRGPGGRMYQVSGWTKADGAADTGMTALVVVFNNLDGTQSRTTMEAPAGSHEWAYLERHVAAAKSFSSIDVIVAVSDQTGSIFFDGLRLRENRVPNGSFEAGLAPWEPYGPGTADGVTDALWRDGEKSLKVAGGPGRRGGVMRMDSGGSAGTVILVGGWNRADAASGAGAYWLSVGFRNRDGTTTWRNLYFPSAHHDWVHMEMIARADKDYASIDVYAVTQDPAGDVAFDAVTLWALA